jgi:DNA-binding transcriptional ArsR family regulator
MNTKKYKTGGKELLKAAELLKILSHPVRLSILCDLIHFGDMGAGEIATRQASQASHSQVSQYLAEFRKKKFVKAVKKGQTVTYSFTSPIVKSIIDILYREYCGKNK